MKKVFIDGRAGTTGLAIYDRLSVRKDISLISLSEEQRKSEEARKIALNQSDIAFLCLPDAAAIQAVALLDNPDTVIIDSSTAHRTSEGWLYGFPELYSDFSGLVGKTKRIAVPGCHAGGFIALVKPLIDSGIIGKDIRLCCNSITGYSGGGKKMIEEYRSSQRNPLLSAPRQYGIAQTHKHLKEMTAISGLINSPIFCPIVADFYSGMEMTVSLFRSDLLYGSAEEIKTIYKEKYSGNIVRYTDGTDENGFLSAAAYSNKDCMEISVFGNEERILLTARYDNLGKGASGAAVECLNYVLGESPEKSLRL